MTVVDKYKPVSTDAESLTSPWAVLVGALVTALCLSLFSIDSLERTVTFAREPSPVAIRVVDTLAGLADATGARAARTWLDDRVAFLQNSPRWFRKGERRPTQEPDVGGPTEPLPPPAEEHPDPIATWQSRLHAASGTRILLVGASSIQYAVGTELQRQLEAYDVVVERKGKLSTGLTRVDVFDWPAEVRTRLERFRPDVVIGQFGGNDAQPMMLDGVRHRTFSEGWTTEYRARLASLCQDVQDAGAQLVILGMPAMREPGFDGRMKRLNTLTQESIEACGGLFLSTRGMSTDPKGDYTQAVRFGGRSGRMRLDDGIHFSRLGGQFIAHEVLSALHEHIDLVPRADEDTPAAAMATVVEIPSEERGPTDAMVYVPPDLPLEGLPVWILLHGAEGSWRDWPDHAHDTLRRLAADKRMILITPDGEPYGWYLDSPKVPDHRIARWMAIDFIPYVRKLLPGNGRIGMTGNSMGGHGALNFAITHEDRLSAVSSMSGVVDLPHASSRTQLQDLLGFYTDAPDAWTSRSAHHRIAQNATPLLRTPLMLSVGKKDLWYEPNVRFHELLESKGVSHRWMVQEGGHSWPVWLEALPEHAAFMADALDAPPLASAPEEPAPDDDTKDSSEPSTQP